ncbi:MAG: hypothetical protein WD534_12945 [Phycisphaeraceae bacterium]
MHGTLLIDLDTVEPLEEWKLECFLAVKCNLGHLPCTNTHGTLAWKPEGHTIEAGVLSVRTDWHDPTVTQSWTLADVEAELEADAPLRERYERTLAAMTEMRGADLLAEAAKLHMADRGVEAEAMAEPDHQGRYRLYVPDEEEDRIPPAELRGLARSAQAAQRYRDRPRPVAVQQKLAELEAKLAAKDQQLAALQTRVDAELGTTPSAPDPLEQE